MISSRIFRSKTEMFELRDVQKPRFECILIISVSNNLLMVAIQFTSLCCVCQSCYAAMPS